MALKHYSQPPRCERAPLRSLCCWPLLFGSPLLGRWPLSLGNVMRAQGQGSLGRSSSHPIRGTTSSACRGFVVLCRQSLMLTNSGGGPFSGPAKIGAIQHSSSVSKLFQDYL